MTTSQPGMTVEDANRRLPLVRVIVRDAVELKADVVARQKRLVELRCRYPEDPLAFPWAEEVLQMEESLEDDEIRIDSFAQELEALGAVLVDPGSGLVEFVSRLDGMQVRLSWMYGEPEVAFWRSENEMPSQRRPLALSGQEAG